MEEATIKMPLIGVPAPSFKAKTTQGEINFPEDFNGKWELQLPPTGDLEMTV